MSSQTGNGIVRIGLLSNPESGRNKRHFSSFRRLFQSCPDLFHEEVVTPDEIRHALAGLADHGVNLLVINGGDGTIQAVVNALMNDRAFSVIPRLAVLPAGTANMIAGDVGLGPYGPGTIETLLASKESFCSERHITKRHLLRLTFPDGTRPMYGMFFGAGAIYFGTQMGRQTKQSVGRLGEWGAGLILARFLVALASGSTKGLHPVSARLSVDGMDRGDREYLVLFVTSLERLFLGMKPFWNPTAGPLHYTGLTVPYRYLWRLLPALLRGKRHPSAIKENGYDSQNPREIRLHLTSGFVLDGEVYNPPAHDQPMILESGGEISFVRLKS
ncbi:MAG: diacylglycerol kinase family protein [Nitrospirales bacterium]